MPIMTTLPPQKLRHTVLVYGPPKVGKTELVSKLADLGYLLDWWDLEDGALTNEKRPVASKNRINLHRIKDSLAVPVAAKTFLKVFDPSKINQDHKICVEHGLVGCELCTKNSAEFETINLGTKTSNEIIVIDSGTQLSQSFLAHAMQTLKGKDGKPKSVFEKPEFDHYATQGMWLNSFFDCMKVLNCHLVYITHEEQIEQEDKVTKMYPISGTRNYAKRFARNFAHVVYTSLQNKKHVASSMTVDSNGVIAGSRTDANVQKPVIEGNPLSAIFDKIN